MTNLDYAPIIAKLKYWRDYDGTGDDYRCTHDLDCVLTNGNLNADTIFSLWLPLRYSMNYFDKPKWQYWRDFEYIELKPKGVRLKDCPDFLNNMIEHIDQFLDFDSNLMEKLSTLFELGQERCNVMLLPQGKRNWNSMRGNRPYYEYMPHFVWDLFAYAADPRSLRRWLDEQDMEPFFAGGTFEQANILDLAGTGSPCRHKPREIKVEKLLDSYIAILRRRKELLALRAM